VIPYFPPNAAVALLQNNGWTGIMPRCGKESKVCEKLGKRCGEEAKGVRLLPLKKGGGRGTGGE